MRKTFIAAVVTIVVSMVAAPAFAISGDSVGLQDPATGKWYISDTSGDVTEFFYGNPGDIPVLGDWDCDGVATPGLFRTSDAFAYLRNSNTEGIADIRFFFGDPADIPLAGDFNGNGCDTLSIYRPSEARFYIVNKLGANNGGLGAADFSFLFGDVGDKPVVGDWDGDGIDEVGLHRESTGFFYWRNSLSQGFADDEIFFGDPNDRFVAGDWGKVDGVDTPSIFRPSNSTFFFRHTLTQGVADSSRFFGSGQMLPVAGPTGDVPDDATSVGRVVPRLGDELAVLVNASRVAECGGVPQLLVKEYLAVVAESHSADMFSNGFFSHTSPTTGTVFDRLDTSGIPWSAAAENIAVDSSAAAMHAAWMASPGHRANICSASFGKVGIGVVDTGFGTLFGTQVFTN